MLKGVSVARRKRLKPAEVTTSRMRASPACAPRHSPTSCDREQGVHKQRRERVVDPAHGIQIVLQLVIGKGLDDHPRPVLGQRLADVRRRSDRVAHVMQAIEDRDEIVVLARKLLCLGHLERDAVGDALTPGGFASRLDRLVVVVESEEIGTWGRPSPSVSWTRLCRSPRRPLAPQPPASAARRATRESTSSRDWRHSRDERIFRTRERRRQHARANPCRRRCGTIPQSAEPRPASPMPAQTLRADRPGCLR